MTMVMLLTMFLYDCHPDVSLIYVMLQGVGGTVQFPKGYMKRAFEMVREKGGVCIADEVRMPCLHTVELILLIKLNVKVYSHS